jgi:NTP pyrophosphatase (non-canonical NTP hydrolase)
MSGDRSLRELTDQVRAFSAARGWHRFHSPRNLAMALSVEANELLELFLWHPGEVEIDEALRQDLGAEAADVLHCLLNLCDRAGVDLEQAFQAKLKVAALKYPAPASSGDEPDQGQPG